MKLLDIIIKEISVVKSQKIAILLILLYPLLAVGLLGFGLSGSSLETFSTAKIGVLNNLPYDLNIQKEIFGQDSGITIINYEDTQELIRGVKTKEVAVGLELNSKSKVSQILVDLYYDNSNIVAGSTFKEFAKITMGSFALTQTRSQLNKVWDVLIELGKNIDSELNQINEFKNKLDDAEKSLDSLESKLNLLDISEIEGTLDSQKENISEFEQKNQDFKSELNSFKQSFSELKEELNDLNNYFSSYSSEMALVSTQLDSAIQGIDIVLQGTIDDESRTILLQQKNNLIETKSKISSLQNFISQITNNSSSLNSKIREADLLFDKFEKESLNISSALQSSNSAIDSMNVKLNVFKESIVEVRTMIVEARKARTDIMQKLDSSSSLMSSFSGELIEFSKIDVDVLSQPIRIYEKRLFQPSAFVFALFPIDPLIIGSITSNAISIVLILTCILLTSIIIILERSDKVALRMSLSQTSKGVFLLGKIIGQLLIALLEATIIFLIVIFVFGLNLLPNMIIIYFATTLISIAFISLGLLISSFTKTQSTAILLSLLAIVPMLFLSGIILPIELMTPLMQTISYFLPLTAANNLLIGLIIKGLFITDLLIEIVVLCMIILIGVLAFMLKENY